jgi:tetratricopeptide (TPR) repeat protein
LNPGSGIANYQLGKVSVEQGHLNEAIDYYRQALKMALQGFTADTDVADTHFNLANALVKAGRLEEAITEYRAALSIRPGDPEAHSNLGYALIQQGGIDEGVAEFEKTLELRPESTLALKNLGYAAWLLTTNPNQTSQGLAKAVGLAERLDQLSRGRDPQIARTLAAAYAKAGRTNEAIMAAQRGIQLALGQANSSLAAALQRELENYRQGTGGQESQPPQPRK